MYVELHSRSAFSFLEGASQPENLIAACANLNMPAMALLDRDGVYGSPRFHMAAKKARIKAHIGAEVTCEYFSLPRHPSTTLRAGSGTEEIRNQKSDSSVPESALSEVEGCLRGEFCLPLLVSSRLGYQNLCRLITKMKLRSAKGEGAVREGELR
jgi:error-prone DNA polymerase